MKENFKIWAHLLLLVLQLHVTSSLITVIKRGPDHRIRTKRSWTYPPINIVEGYGEFPLVIAKIKSDNPQARIYKLRGDGVGTNMNDENVKFVIYEDTGVIKQLREVDREKKSSYKVVASALSANGQTVEDDVTLFITVIDMNDNKPIFIQSTLWGSVPEGNDPSSPPFMFVNVTDADSGMNGRAGISYSIVPGSDKPPSSSPRFSIDKDTGKVSVRGKLDYEKDQKVYFTVQAEDAGNSPGIISTATVTITVLDSNDHAPVLEKTPPKSVSELFHLNVTLYEISATDVDEGKNKKVYFEIISGNTGGTFKIESKPSDVGKSIGNIKLEKKLDFEDGETEFSLRIKAYNKLADNADSYAMASFSTVVIKVKDGNEPPEFLNTPYNTVISEATKIPMILSLSISARDRDFAGNQSITYSIADDPENWFTIDPINGKITATKKLDREARSVVNSMYTLGIRATDNYPGNPASVNGQVLISIEDVNDSPPLPTLSENEMTVKICEKPTNQTVLLIEAADSDDYNKKNGPPFTFRFNNSVPGEKWDFKEVSPTASQVMTYVKDFELESAIELKLPFHISDSGSPAQTGTATLTVSVCSCPDGIMDCAKVGTVAAGGIPLLVIVAIIVVLLLVLILVFAAVAYKRRHDARRVKEQPLFDDEDDIRENIQVYHEEGGEEDQDAYDLSALRAPLLDDVRAPNRIDEKPLQQAPYAKLPRGEVPDDIGEYIGDAKDQADNDPSAPPFDSLLVFDYEGQDSDTGSLSSINTATTDGSMDYDYLNDWGPRFKKLSDMYNNASDSD